MTEIEQAVERVRAAAAGRGAMKRLAEEAGVPYSTVHSFAQRDWANKNLEVIEKLVAAADRLAQQDAA